MLDVMADETKRTCCIAGGGPAGILLGYLLARRGVDVTVFEKHADFFRDFRGDTVHPSTLEVMDELGLVDDLLRLPHQKVSSVKLNFGEREIGLARMDRLPVRHPFVALMPQWDFLNFLAERARQYPNFNLRMGHEVVGLVREGSRVAGVSVRTPRGTQQIRADLVVACDGRHSVTRSIAGLPLKKIGVPIDVLWFRIPRRDEDGIHGVAGHVNYGQALVLIDRGDYYQAGLIIPKDGLGPIQERGLPAFRESLAQLVPALADRFEEIRDWDQVKLLSVQINRLRQWHRPGLLCIGDAAHAMSPAFGVGINLAIQDAVATDRIVGPALKNRTNTDALLEVVERRRNWPTAVTQLLQMMAHKGLEYVFRHPGPMEVPLPLRVVEHIPGIRHAMGYMVGIGVRPEHATGRAPCRLWTSHRVQQAMALSAGLVFTYALVRRLAR